jgi:hypothetical protein
MEDNIMLGKILWLIVAGSALFVYYDASEHNIRHKRDESGFSNADPALWAFFVLILWIIFFPLYLINRSRLIEKAKLSPKEPLPLRQLWFVVFFAIFLFSLYFAFIYEGPRDSSEVSVSPTHQQYQSTPRQTTQFNASDKSIATNGNFIIAANKILNSSSSAIWQAAQSVSPANVTKSPYSSIGKLYKLNGQVYKVEEFPPTPNLSGQWAEVLLLVNNPNSPTGTTTVSFFYNGDINQVNANTYIICAGYFIGTYESQNALGGTVEGLVLVGNVFRSQ